VHRQISRPAAALKAEFALPNRSTGGRDGPVVGIGRTPGDDVGHECAGTTKAARILIVEDDHLVAIASEAALLDAGFDVTGIAATADEAVAMARSSRPDLVIMDVRLGGRRDGIDAAREIYSEVGVRCIFATAHHDAHTRTLAQGTDPLAWLPKPYQPDALVRAVQTALIGLRGFDRS
jgi:two-component system, response regulator PdtaR